VALERSSDCASATLVDARLRGGGGPQDALGAQEYGMWARLDGSGASGRWKSNGAHLDLVPRISLVQAALPAVFMESGSAPAA